MERRKDDIMKLLRVRASISSLQYKSYGAFLAAWNKEHRTWSKRIEEQRIALSG